MSVAAKGRKIAIIGASGNLGKPLVKALLGQRVHTITAIQRLEATTSFPSLVNVVKGDLKDETFLQGVLRGQDALVLLPPLSHLVELQKPAIKVAAEVGIPYILPSEFGPSPLAERLIQENELLLAKKSIREYIQELGVSHWISIVVGPWYDVNLGTGLWGIDYKKRKATLWRGASAKVSTASIEHTAQAAAAVLSLPEAELANYKNRGAFAPSWNLTQREILEAVQRATETSDANWDIQEIDAPEVLQESEEKIKQGDGWAPYVKFFVTHFLENHGGAIEEKSDLDRLNQLGLEVEDLAVVTRQAVQ